MPVRLPHTPNALISRKDDPLTKVETHKGCAFVTGGGRGIGATIAKTLAADGWPVAIGYHTSHATAQAVVQEIIQAGGQAHAMPGDIQNPEVIDQIFSDLEDRFGRVAVLVNNAGIRDDGVLTGLTDEAWQQVMDTNVTAAFRLSQRAMRTMIRARHGRVINITSFVATQAIAGISNYAASKAALAGLTRALAVEVAHRGVTVNAVAPGLVATDLTRDLGHFETSVKRGVPMRRPAHLNEIAAGVRFLASDEASYITGQTLTIDGGLSAMAFSLN
jgi:3-oxoacyl-[acyl-carrier protein] reductase